MTPEELIESWYAATPKNSPDEALTHTLWRIVEDHPEWFNAELTGDPLQMLLEAIAEAQDDMPSGVIIEAAYWLIKSNPDWLSDTPQTEALEVSKPITEPEPLSASEALVRAHMRADIDSPESSILWAVVKYAETNPEWFRDWGKYDDPVEALESAAYFGYAAAHMTAWHVLSAVKRIAADNPALFDGDDEPEPITVTTDKEAAEPIEYATVEYAQGYDAGYAEGAKAQREADAKALHADGWFHAGNKVENQPLVTDNEDTTVTSGIEAVKRIAYGEGWEAGYAEGHAAGWRW